MCSRQQIQNESVGISNYYIDEKSKYSYETSRANDYCRAILKNSDEQWVNGLRWTHGEDSETEIN